MRRRKDPREQKKPKQSPNDASGVLSFTGQALAAIIEYGKCAAQVGGRVVAGVERRENARLFFSSSRRLYSIWIAV